MNNRHPDNLLPAYALGCLDPEDLAQVEDHLAGCARCAEEVRAFEETCAELAHLAPVTEPPDALGERLGAIAAAQSESIRKRPLSIRIKPVPFALAAGLVLLLAIGLANLLMPQLPSPGQATLVQLAGTGPTPQAKGVLSIIPGETSAQLQVEGLKSLPSDAQYQLWLIRDGVRSSGGVFSVAADGSGSLNVTASMPLETFDAFGITIEPYGGSPGPTGPKVLGGKLAG